MATVTYADNATNPLLETIFRPGGTVTTSTETTKRIDFIDGSYIEYTGIGFLSFPFVNNVQSIAFGTASGLVATATGPFLDSITNMEQGRTFNGLSALQSQVFPGADVFTGGTGDDALSTYGGSAADTLDAGGGADTLRSLSSRAHQLIGGVGDDVFRLEAGADVAIHGSAADGTGGIGETDAIEVAGIASAATITNIDALRFSGTGSSKQFTTNAFQVGPGRLSTMLDVTGTSSTTDVEQVVLNRTGGAAETVDLSGWTFTDFTGANKSILINVTNNDTNQVDSVVGSSARDTIFTGGGADTIRGGGGVDELQGGAGDDVFLYGAGEAAAGEYVRGGSDSDTVRAIANVDFTGARFYEVEKIEFAGATALTFDQALTLEFVGGFIGTATRQVVGDGGANALAVQIDGSSSNRVFYGDNLTFTGWTVGVDTLTVQGSSQDDQVYTTSVRASYIGGAGSDQLLFLRPAATAGETLDFSDPTVLQTFADGSTAIGFDSFFMRFGSGGDTFRGGALNDYIEGGEGADVLDGGLGIDTVLAGGGDDQLFSRLGEGSDGNTAEYLNGGADVDFALIDRSTSTRSFNLDLGDPSQQTSIGDGTVMVNVERVEFRAGSGNDTLTGGVLADILRGGAGRDLLSGGAGDDVLDGGDGIDLIDGGAGVDTLLGGAGADTLDGGAGADSIDGGDGNDNIDGGADDDTLFGRGGIDAIAGGAGADTIDGGAGADTLDGGDGNDTVDGGDGNDNLDGGDGADTLFGRAGIDSIFGGTGNDLIDGGEGADTLDGGTGSDTLTFAGFTKGVIVDLDVQATNDADRLTSIENVVGTAFDDIFFGSSADNVLDGGTGGVDKLHGYGGIDTASYASAGAAIIIDLSAQAASDGDTFISIENAIGTAFNDTVFGSGGDNVMDGGTGGADKLHGYGGSDTASYASALSGLVIDLHVQAASDGDTFISVENATGSAFADTFFGSSVGNVLNGGGGSDMLWGFAGADTFVFRDGFGQDTVGDFAGGVDKVQLQASQFANFAAVQTAATQVGADTLITLNLSNTITLKNVTLASLQAGDFMFV